MIHSPQLAALPHCEVHPSKFTDDLKVKIKANAKLEKSDKEIKISQESSVEHTESKELDNYHIHVADQHRGQNCGCPIDLEKEERSRIFLLLTRLTGQGSINAYIGT